MIQTSVVVCFSTVLAGCGVLGAQQGTPGAQGVQGDRGADGPPGPPGFASVPATESGERIKARYLVSDDGARTPMGWTDADTGLPCEFVRATDGADRCLPAVVRRDPLRVFYNDDSCAGPAVAFEIIPAPGPCTGVGPYVIEPSRIKCDPSTVVYHVGQALTGSMPGYCSDDGGACGVNSGSQKTDIFSLTLVDPSMFVAAAIK